MSRPLRSVLPIFTAMARVFTAEAASPDGSSVAYVSQDSHLSQQYYRLPLEHPSSPDGLPTARGVSEPLTNGGGLWHVHGGSFSSDGSSFVYDRDQDYGDVFLIENYR